MNRIFGFFVAMLMLVILAGCASMNGGSADTSRRVKFTDSPDGARATMDDEILFAVNSAVLYQQTDELFDLMKPTLQRAKGKIRVEGHTDSTGNAALNSKLSQQRADAVKAALVARQVAPSRVEAKGYGSSRSVIQNAKTPEEHAKNRRAVIVFVGETVESIGGNDLERALSDAANKITGWLTNLIN